MECNRQKVSWGCGYQGWCQPPACASTAPLGPRSTQKLHALMDKKHPYTKPGRAYIKSKGNRDSQDPSLIDGALESQGRWNFLEIPSTGAASWVKEAEIAPQEGSFV